ncbi:MAG: uroporphyrinogen decarboxylase family protein [Victivallaceae bacterium]|nr:uroporphyrinogen decarboxylase family protein [Victivallaceae bacterium]
MSDKMTASERFRAVLDFSPTDRLPLVEWAPYWDKTKERWEKEGMPGGMDNEAMQRYFNLDVVLQNWVAPLSAGGAARGTEGELVSDEADYEKLLEEGRLFSDEQLNADILDRWAEWDKKRRIQGDSILMLTFLGFFWFPRTLFGIEPHFYAFYDWPELMHRMNRDLAEYNLKCLERFCGIAKPDFVTFAEDMSYNNGPMLSENLFDEFMLPCYKMLIPRLKELDIKVIIDSDGDITECAGWFRRAGADGMLPLERQAGVDINILRKKYRDMCWIGAYDKMVMNRGEAAIRNEFERLMPVAEQGGLIISCDHQTPPGVSLEQYRCYLKCFRGYAVKRNLSPL